MWSCCCEVIGRCGGFVRISFSCCIFFLFLLHKQIPLFFSINTWWVIIKDVWGIKDNSVWVVFINAGSGMGVVWSVVIVADFALIFFLEKHIRVKVSTRGQRIMSNGCHVTLFIFICTLILLLRDRSCLVMKSKFFFIICGQREPNISSSFVIHIIIWVSCGIFILLLWRKRLNVVRKDCGGTPTSCCPSAKSAPWLSCTAIHNAKARNTIKVGKRTMLIGCDADLSRNGNIAIRVGWYFFLALPC